MVIFTIYLKHTQCQTSDLILGYNSIGQNIVYQLIVEMIETLKNPKIQELVFRLRDPKTNKSQFRHSLEKIGEYMALKIAETLETTTQTITTLLDKDSQHSILSKQPVLVTILRAGLSFHYGIQKVFEESQSGFIGAMRNQETLQPNVSYIALPKIEGETVIIADTMLATGGSFIEVIKQVKKRNPKKIIIAAVIAAVPGIKNIQEYDSTLPIYCATIDPELNSKGYIVPGLGDAGDRSFGCKI